MTELARFDLSKYQFVGVAQADELPAGQRLTVEIEDEAITVFNIAGTLFAIGDLCTHEDNSLAEGELNEYEIVCPYHGARFDVRTGKALCLPAVMDTPVYPVRVADNEIQVGILI